MTTNLLQLANAVRSCEESYAKKVILFGAPGTAKTHIAGTIAKVPSISKVYWFDLENGLETLIYAKTSTGVPLLSDEELSKIIPIRIQDTAELPRAAETFLKAFTATRGVKLCTSHGTVGCKQCKEQLDFNLFSMDESTAIVIDSLSQLSSSVIALARNANPDIASIQRIFGIVNPNLSAILSGIQASKANIIACTHTLDITKTKVVGKNQVEEVLLRTVPMCGSRPFSDLVGKFWGYKIYTYVNGATYRATVKPGKLDKILVSSRRPVSFEGDTDSSLEKLFLSEEEASKEIAETKPPISISKPNLTIKV
jgi:hypothetical protein